MNLPKRGAAILRAVGEDGDPNWKDIPTREGSRHLRERYWIKQWSGKRWPCSDLVQASGKAEVALAKLGRKPDDPGDAFFYLYQITSRWFVWALTWVEVTEICLPGQDEMVKLFVRQQNELPGKGRIDTRDFLNTLELGLPDARLQREMADRVIAAVEKKARKGRDGGSYRTLAAEYGRGVLIVGLPLWFAGLPKAPENPAEAVDDFTIRLGIGLKSIERSVLRTSWCPFDSIVVLWNPSAEALDASAERAGAGYYNDPANLSLKRPFSLLKAHGALDLVDRTAARLDVPIPDIVAHVDWHRYRSVDAMLADQFRQFRLFRGPRPMGPKSQSRVSRRESERSWKFGMGVTALSILLFVRIHGWQGLRRSVLARLSVRRAWSRWRMRLLARRFYVEENRQAGSGSGDNPRSK